MPGIGLKIIRRKGKKMSEISDKINHEFIIVESDNMHLGICYTILYFLNLKFFVIKS